MFLNENSLEEVFNVSIVYVHTLWLCGGDFCGVAGRVTASTNKWRDTTPPPIDCVPVVCYLIYYNISRICRGISTISTPLRSCTPRCRLGPFFERTFFGKNVLCAPNRQQIPRVRSAETCGDVLRLIEVLSLAPSPEGSHPFL